MNTAKLRHTIAAIIGALAVVGPQLMNLVGEWKSPKAAVVLSALGFVVALAINGKAVALLNLILPEPGAPNAANTADAVTRPETPSAKTGQ